MSAVKGQWFVRRYMGRRGPFNPDYTDVILNVLVKYDVTLPMLRRKDRREAIVKIRDEAIDALHKHGASQSEIAYFLKCAPNTVSVALSRFKERQSRFVGAEGVRVGV